MSWSTVNRVGEMADPVSQKARRAHDRQGASASGVGPTDQPGMPSWPTQGKRKNGNLSSVMGSDASPKIARRRRGAR